MSYLLYFNPDSANLVVRMILEELGLDYEDEQVARKRSDRSAAFLELNPRGLLPVLIDRQTGRPLFETGAIGLYLADKHGRLAPSPSSVMERGDCLKWLFMLSNTLHADLNVRFYPERYVTEETEIPRLWEASRQRVLGHLELLDHTIAETGGDWFLSSGLSVCDFYLGCCARWAQMYPVGHAAASAADIAALPHLRSLLERVQDLKSVQRALEKEGIRGPAFVEPVTHLPARVADAVGTVMP